jgi:hypothetical protein
MKRETPPERGCKLFDLGSWLNPTSRLPVERESLIFAINDEASHADAGRHSESRFLREAESFHQQQRLSEVFSHG